MAVNVGVAVTLLGAGGAYAYIRYRFDSIKTIAAPSLAKSDGSATESGGTAENILMIGNQTRSGLTNPQEIAAMGSPQALSGSLSDVIMILHLSAQGKASILSIPRDLFAEMPANSPVGSYQKIDAALNDGTVGPNNLIQAIEQDWGIPINHYVELEFDGFENTVNAIGGIHMDFPERLWDAYSQLNITKTGCQSLNGSQALALVRARHLQYDPPGDNQPKADWPYDPESDLARIVRDHEFLRVLMTTALHQGLGNPIKLNAFIGAVINQIIIDPGLKSQLISLAEKYKHLNPNAIPETTLSVVPVNGYTWAGIDMGDVDFPVQPADDNTIKAWDGGALPTPAAPSSVTVLNDVGTTDLAGQTAAALRADGVDVTTTGDGTTHANPAETLVDYHAGSLAQAVYVMDRMNGAVMLNLDNSIAPGTVTVEAGTTFTVTGSQSPAGSSLPGSSVSGSSASGGSSTTSATTSPTVAATTSTTVPTVGGTAPSASADRLTPWDPRPCTAA